MLYGVINILVFNLFIRLTRLSDNWNQLADIFNNEEPQRVAIAMVDCATEVELCTGTLDGYLIYGCMQIFNFLSRCILFLTNFFVLARFHFTLRGTDGEEVTVKDDNGTRNATLTATLEGFFTSDTDITIQTHGRRIAYFQSSDAFDGRRLDVWHDWNCDGSNPSNPNGTNPDGLDLQRCDAVRSGQMVWRSTYEFTFTSMLLW